MSAPKRPHLRKIQGLNCAYCVIPELLLATTKYKPSPSDVFVVTYPKCGTSWMIQIVTLILRKGQLPADSKEYSASSPFLDMLGPDVIKDMPGPGCLKTHLPFHMAPFSPDAKYIHVARHPRDCVVSFYHHIRFFPQHRFTEGTFDDFFDAFMAGEVHCGDYFDHLRSWYEHREEPNILFTTYEEMKADVRGAILKVAKFLGEEYLRELEEDEALLKEIIEKSSIGYMKDSTNQMWNDIMQHFREIMNDSNAPNGLRMWAKSNAEAMDDGERPIGQFIRGGEGNVSLSEDQERRLNERIQEEMRKSDVMNLWK